VHGQHTFELLRDPRVAFIQSGTRLGREAKVDVSERTKSLVREAFALLRPQDLPDRRDERVIRSGDVPKASIYEVVSLRHPARFFTRPDQSAFALVATRSYGKLEAIGTYIGVFRDFDQFHKASDQHAMKQVYAYDCMAAQIPGPPNPHLSAAEKARPVREQLSYRGGDLIVESLYYGNEVRFMNDCYGRSGADATVNAHASIVWDRERQWPCILVRATYPIAKGDEIVCDYGDEFWNKVARSLMMDHASYADEVRELIRDTEEWMRINQVPVPSRPTAQDSNSGTPAAALPLLFTTDRARDVVVYPRGFLKGDKDEGKDGAGADDAPADAAECEEPAAKSARLHALQQGLDSMQATAATQAQL